MILGKGTGDLQRSNELAVRSACPFHNPEQPWNEVLQVEGSLLEKLHHGCVDRVRVGCNPITVDTQKNVDDSKGDSFVAVHEGMILNQAFQKSRRFLNDGFVVPRLRAMQTRLQRANISDAGRSAIALDELLMKEECVRSRDVLGHLANER